MAAAAWAGSAMTRRPIVAEAWRRCCAELGIPFLGEAALEGTERSTMMLVDSSALSTDVGRERWAPTDAVVLLATPRDDAAVRAMLRSGVDGLVSELDDLDTIFAAAASVMAGRKYVSHHGAELLLAHYLPRALAQPAHHRPTLTAREREVLQGIVDGLTTKAIARRLGLAVKTVEAHRSRLFSHLGVSTQREAVVRALSEPDLLSFAASAAPSGSMPR